MSAAPERPRVVIVGAGFGGLTLARALRRTAAAVTLIDRNNYHLFTPLLYQVASSLLDPGEVAQPVRALIRPLRNCEFRLATVRGLDLAGRRLITDTGEVAYDYLVVASGSVTNYYGNRSLEQRSLGLKELPQAMALRNWILERFERASRLDGDAERQAELTFAVIGGGPTGVEFAGALSELIRLVLRRDYPELDVARAQVLLLEGAPRLLSAFDPRLSEAARQSLARKGVDVRLDTMVKDVRPGEVDLNDGQQLRAASVIWTAGVRASDLGQPLAVGLDRMGRVPVEPTLQVKGHPEVFAIGDLASRDELPMLIPVAMQEAKHTARAIGDLIAGRPPAPFRYRDPGIMATIGRNAAVAQIGPLRLTGFFGWLTWLGVHLVNIVSFRARVVVLLNWAWEYLFYDRPIRIIVRADPPPGG